MAVKDLSKLSEKEVGKIRSEYINKYKKLLIGKKIVQNGKYGCVLPMKEEIFTIKNIIQNRYNTWDIIFKTDGSGNGNLSYPVEYLPDLVKYKKTGDACLNHKLLKK